MHIKTSEQEEFLPGMGDNLCNRGTRICGLYESKNEPCENIYDFLCQGFTDRTLDVYYKLPK